MKGFLSVRFFLAFVFWSAGMLLALLSLAGAPSPSLTRPTASERNAAGSKIAPWVLEQTANGGQAEFLIVMVDQADLNGAAALRTKPEKTGFVRDALWKKTQATQGPVLHWLREQKIEHRSYYVVNLIWAKASLDVAQALAARPDVGRIEGNPEFRQNLPQPAFESQARGPGADNVETPASVELGISYTRAPEVWALGYTGQGIVIGAVDTGVRWDHNALKNKYRGWNGTAADHNFNWHDSVHSSPLPCGPNSPQPCDDHGQGTHTMGTMVGDDGAGNQIGMAPGAKWIGCRSFDDNSGTAAQILECLEFLLAPYPVSGTPEQGDPEKAPDVVLYSFQGPADDIFRPAIASHRAAGIMPVANAGNNGPGCGTIGDPGRYDESYTAGALVNGTDSIAGFSGRGPAMSGNEPLLKPDLTAPGTNVRSSSNSGLSFYQSFSGSSMAGAHVAGGVALLWSADPSLRGCIDETERILNHAAFDIPSSGCDPPNPVSPNNVYGHGRLDVKAAVVGFVVTTTDDHNDGTCSLTDCTLREAINAANAQAGDEIIRFAPGLMGTIQLSSELPQIYTRMFIAGPGPNVLTVRRNTAAAYRIFVIANPPQNNAVLTISGLTIANGLAPNGGTPIDSGGGIINDRCTLTIRECILTGNSSSAASFSYGGGICNSDGTLVVDRSTFSGNSASYGGGGIAHLRSTVTGIGSVTITNSTFVANTAPYGLGVYNEAQNSGRVANLTTTHCTFSGHIGPGSDGAGIFNRGAFGGAANLAVSHCTFAGNSAAQGSSVYSFNFNGSASATLRNSVFASSGGASLANGGGSMVSLGYNLSNDGGAGVLNDPTDITNTPPLLAPLAFNGGPIQTHALLSNSPALDKGRSFGLTKDARGAPRLVDFPGVPNASGGDGSDIGAFELTPPLALVGVVSRKSHGAAGAFDIVVAPGVESRSGGAGEMHRIIFTFSNPLESVGAVNFSGAGSVSGAGIGSDAREYIVDLIGVTNAQVVSVSLANVNDFSGNHSDLLTASLGVLLGDTNCNGTVNATDVGQAKAQSGQPVTAANFRNDVNVNGSINATDIGQVKAQSGTQLPP
ncbi:MAG: S8 family serine peptidase [Chthoniobacterales bacterium]